MLLAMTPVGLYRKSTPTSDWDLLFLPPVLTTYNVRGTLRACLSISAQGTIYLGLQYSVQPGEPAINTKGELWRSLDNGRNWIQVGSGVFQSGIVLVHPSIHSPDVLFVSTGDTLFKSGNAGKSWAAVHSGFVANLVEVPSSPSNVYVRSDDRLFRSMDGGANFQELPVSAERVIRRSWPSRLEKSKSPVTRIVWLGYNSFAPEEIIIAEAESATNLLVSKDGGVTWSTFSDQYSFEHWYFRSAADGGMLARVRDITVQPVQQNSPQSIWVRSLDGGRTWTRLDPQLGLVGEIDTLMPMRGQRLLVQSSLSRIINSVRYTYGTQLHLSSDNGASWQMLSRGLPTSASNERIAFSDNDGLSVGTREGLWIGKDDVWRFEAYPNGGRNPPERVVPASGEDRFVVLPGDSVLRVAPGKATQALRLPGAPMWLVEDPAKSTTLYTAVKVGGMVLREILLLKSEDGGLSWAEMPVRNLLGDSVRRPRPGEVPLLIDIRNSKNLLCSATFHYADELRYHPTTSFRLLKSTDGGDSWQDISGPLLDRIRRSWPTSGNSAVRQEPTTGNGSCDGYGMPVALVQSKNGTVYFGLRGGPVFSSTDWGASWLDGSIPPSAASNCSIIQLATNPPGDGLLFRLANLPQGPLIQTSVDRGITWAAFEFQPLGGALQLHLSGKRFFARSPLGIFELVYLPGN